MTHHAEKTEIIRHKITRFKRGNKLRVLDLFSGCGGMSLGFVTAGYHLLGGVEIDPHAAASHALNFFPAETEESLRKHHGPIDITEYNETQLLRKLGIRGKVQTSVDVLIGGPPCQAFSIVGRAKLRSLAGAENAYLEDDRAKLVHEYMDLVDAYMPLAVVIENVPEILRYGSANVPEDLCATLEDLGYDCKYTILNSVFYGVPQLRDRLFLIAYRKELGIAPTFPEPSHYHRLPSGYQILRKDVERRINGTDLFQRSHLIKPFDNERKGKPAVTCAEALSDLPKITLHLEGKLKKGPIRFTTLSPYSSIPQSSYSKLMRTWSGFQNTEGVYDHMIRYLPRDYQIFRVMDHNDEYPQAHAKALRLFNDALQNLRKTGEKIEEGTEEYEKLKKAIVPPYDPKKFANKWRKLSPTEPARTLTAHLGKDSYSHIHYDSDQARTISVREAARLQSFPDGFKFVGTLDPAKRQIGNAVPPLLALSVAKHVIKSLTLATKDVDTGKAVS